ncbi:MAG: septum formation protein Maf [Halobacteriovoraceae bacterium]|nr:septum formation protein Maf [Halobacteriovoraceae bacterium]|tara:strand:- start:6245 stop:6826 length:582 start_codon:yes stop_codon:yes gene_type:complete
MKKLILASKSPYRKEILAKIGVPFECVSSGFDEDELKKTYSDPQVLTQKLAIGKAQAIEANFQGAVIIGSDQVCHVDGKILGKTGNIADSLEQLKLLQDRTHELVTSYCLLYQGEFKVRTNVTKLTMRKLSESQLKNYLSIDNPIDCAGSYKLELNGIGLMKKVETEDYTAIIGLPLVALTNDLEELGFSVFS